RAAHELRGPLRGGHGGPGRPLARGERGARLLEPDDDERALPLPDPAPALRPAPRREGGGLTPRLEPPPHERDRGRARPFPLSGSPAVSRLPARGRLRLHAGWLMVMAHPQLLRG